MRSTFLARIAVLAFLCVVAGAARAICPPPDFVCDYYYPGSVLTAYCFDDACYEMNYGEEMRVVAADERGFYTDMFHVWTEATISTIDIPIPCQLEAKKKKIRVKFPEEMHCAVDLKTDSGWFYHEFFASDPLSGCLGWGECREPLTPAEDE